MKKKYFIYLFVAWATISLISGAIYLTNYLVDPLWYYDGNRFNSYNFVYNSRYSKTNVFLKGPKTYDCIILGSSTATTLNPKLIKGYNCYNYAIGAGNLREFISILRFAKHFSSDIRLVVVGLDGFNLVDQHLDDQSPGYMRTLGPPPGSSTSYLSLNVFFFSLRSIMKSTHLVYYYGRDFDTALLLPWLGQYKPDKNNRLEFRQRYDHALGRITTRNLLYLEQLRALVPHAKFIGYVPPIHVDYFELLDEEFGLNGYIESMHQAAEYFDALYDFTLPSKVTADSSITVDGMHYSREINKKIADVINGRRMDFGIDLRKIPRDKYFRSFLRAAEAYLNEDSVRSKARFARESR